MGFRNPILAGTELVREAIRSPNFTPGVSGWQISRDGSAEFNALIARGGLSVGDAEPGNNAASWGEDPPAELVAAGYTNALVFYSTDWNLSSTTPKAKYKFIGTAGGSLITGFGYVVNPSVDPDAVIIVTGTGDGLFYNSSGVSLSHWERRDIAGVPFVALSAGATNRDFVIWDENGDIRVLGQTSPGTTFFHVHAPGGTSTGVEITCEITRMLLSIDSPGGLRAPDMRSQDRYAQSTVSTPGGAAGTTFQGLGGNDIGFTFAYPPSGVVEVKVRAAIQGSQIDQYGVMGFEIRDNNVSGTVRQAASDDRAVFALSKTVNQSLGIMGVSEVVTGLPTSGTGYIRPMYRSNASTNVATFGFRGVVVSPSP